ncbi:hypothetical protein D3C87_1526120 [compost metagenome]
MGGPSTLQGPVASEIQLSDMVHRGLPTGVLAALEAGDVLTREELLQLIFSKATLSRRLREPRLSEVESDKIVRLSRIVASAIDVFGDAPDAHEWLREANPALDGRTPLEMATTDPGARLVETLLKRLDYGDYT